MTKDEVIAAASNVLEDYKANADSIAKLNAFASEACVSREKMEVLAGGLRQAIRAAIPQDREIVRGPTESDVTHDLMIRLLERLTSDKFDFSYLPREVKQAKVDRWRHETAKKRDRTNEESQVSQEKQPAAALAVGEVGKVAETRAQYMEALNLLDPKAREVIQLRRIFKLSVEETAKALGISTSSVKRREKSALETIKQHVDGNSNVREY